MASRYGTSIDASVSVADFKDSRSCRAWQISSLVFKTTGRAPIQSNMKVEETKTMNVNWQVYLQKINRMNHAPGLDFQDMRFKKHQQRHTLEHPKQKGQGGD